MTYDFKYIYIKEYGIIQYYLHNTKYNLNKIKKNKTLQSIQIKKTR